LSNEDHVKKLMDRDKKIVLLGIAVVIVVIVILFIVQPNLYAKPLQVSDFPHEKFKQGYDIICIDDVGCLIKISKDMKWFADQENEKFLVDSETRNMTMYYNYGSKEMITEQVNHLVFNATKFDFSIVVGLNFTEPIFLLDELPEDEEEKPTDNDFWQIQFFQTAFAQIEPFELELREVNEVKDCTIKTVASASAYIPFTFKVFYDPTEDRKFEIVQQSRSFPIQQQTPQVMVFHTNYTDQYNIYFEINYDTPRERNVFIQYLSRGELTQTETEKFNGNKFCMNLVVNTSESPKIPTKEEMFGDAYYYFSQIPVLIEGFNRNSLTTGSSISYQWLVSAGVIIVVLLLIIQNAQNKKLFNSKMGDIDDIIEIASEREKKEQERFNDIKDLQEDIVRNQEKILDMQKEEVQGLRSKETVVEEPPKTETISGFRKATEKLSNIKNILKKKPSEEDPIVEGKELEDLLGKEEKPIKTYRKEKTEHIDTKTKSPVSLEKMDPLTKQILNKIDYKDLTADFSDFSYDSLTHALEWVNEFIQQSNYMKISEEKREKQLKMQRILHEGAIRKWEKEHGKPA